MEGEEGFTAIGVRVFAKKRFDEWKGKDRNATDALIELIELAENNPDLLKTPKVETPVTTGSD